MLIRKDIASDVAFTEKALSDDGTRSTDRGFGCFCSHSVADEGFLYPAIDDEIWFGFNIFLCADP